MKRLFSMFLVTAGLAGLGSAFASSGGKPCCGPDGSACPPECCTPSQACGDECCCPECPCPEGCCAGKDGQ